jgi:hypothetical protein
MAPEGEFHCVTTVATRYVQQFGLRSLKDLFKKIGFREGLFGTHGATPHLQRDAAKKIVW